MKNSSMNPFCINQLLAAASFFAMSAGAHALDYIWDASSSQVWETAANWSTNNVPNAATELAVFDGTAVGVQSVTYASQINAFDGILMKSAQTSALSIDMSRVDTAQNFRITSATGITIESGAGAFSFGAGGSGLAANLIINGNSTFKNDSTNLATIGTNATVAATTSIASTLTFGGTGSWKVDAVVKNAGTPGILSLAKADGGTTTLTAANTYTGSTAVNGGTLLVNGTHIKTTGGGYTVTNAGSTLGGTGRIAINANVSVASGAFLGPGAGGIGTLTLDGVNRTGDVLTMTTGAKFGFELAGNGASADQLAFWNYTGGDLVLNSNAINLDLLGALTPGTYNVNIFNFFSNAGATATTHAFASGLTIGSLDPNISSASIDWDGTGNDNKAIAVNFTVVPEPNVAALMGGLGMLALLRRRRN